MFDVGFIELLIVGLVALLVVGPERLPGLARTAGAWLRKGRDFVGSVKADVEQELKAEELKRILNEQKEQLNPLHEIIEDTKKDFTDLKDKTETALSDEEKVASAGSEEKKDKGADDRPIDP